MPTVNLSTETMDVDVQVKTAKRRFKIPTATFRCKDDEQEKRDRKILESTKWKPYKTRAIQRARDLKYADDGRGEEAPLDTWWEELNSRLSSREVKRFKIVHTYGEKVSHCTLVGGNWILTKIVEERSIDVAAGVIYRAHKKADITVVNMLNDRPCHLYAETDFMAIEKDIFELVARGPGRYETIIY